MIPSLFSEEAIDKFRNEIWNYYRVCGRSFVWRETQEPYQIFVSEIMLQQTQTQRVESLYPIFLQKFPNFTQLAEAPTREVLRYWQGLGYNRRALFLQKSAQKVVKEFNGVLPDDPSLLISFPGIGKATAGSICAFAFNKATLFIETNIRSVFIHFFFPNQTKVKDDVLLPLVEKTLDHQQPRLWYYALTDYGVMLKKNIKNPSQRSAHYYKQSVFEGSDRQIRGQIIKALTENQSLSYVALINLLDKEENRIERIISDLVREGFIKERNRFFFID